MGELVDNASEAGVGRILTVGIDLASIRRAVEMATEHEPVYAALGHHPHGAGSFSEDVVKEIEQLAAHPKVRAIGETGLDYYRDLSPRGDQERAFVAQIGLARRLELPLVVHTRSAEEDTLRLLDEHARGLTVILHCFSLAEHLDECDERGYYYSFAGNVTYSSADDLQGAAERVPDEMLLLETDSPYLSPRSRRGRPNAPAHVRETASFVAKLRGQSYEQLEAVVEANAARVFGW